MHALMIKYAKRRRLMSIANLVSVGTLVFVMFNIYNNSGGIYSREINTIMIFPKDNPVWAQFFTASHEIGHYAYFQKLSEVDRLEYEKLFNDSNQYISEYSETNAAENFAEEFAYATSCWTDPKFVSESRREYFIEHYYDMMRYGNE